MQVGVRFKNIFQEVEDLSEDLPPFLFVLCSCARGEVAVTPLHPLCNHRLFIPLLPFQGECVETEPSHETLTRTFLVWRLFPRSFSTFQCEAIPLLSMLLLVTLE